MIRAYDELYIGYARKAMAHMLDRAVHAYGMKLQEFFSLFLVSPVSARFQSGDCSIVAGRSGAELVRIVLEETGMRTEERTEDTGCVILLDRPAGEGIVLDRPAGEGIVRDRPAGEGIVRDRPAGEGRSREYWTGWALAYYQWYSGMTFEQIERHVSIGNVREMYSRYHEMDILQFCDAMEERVRNQGSRQAGQEGARRQTRLQFYRRSLGLSQSQLAAAAEIPVRTIQQYEQRRKNINRAQAGYLIRLARALGCREEDLMES